MNKGEQSNMIKCNLLYRRYRYVHLLQLGLTSYAIHVGLCLNKTLVHKGALCAE